MTTNLHDKMLAAIDAYFSASNEIEAHVAEGQLLDVRDEINNHKLAAESLNEGLRLDDWDKIGCVNHDCGQCKELAEQPAQDNTYGYAKGLAESLFKKHYAHEEHYASGRIVWEVSDTTIGLLTQIDNMVCTLVRPAEQSAREWVGLTDADYYNACLSYRHDFGLMSEDERQKLVFEAKEWARAFGITKGNT